MNSILYSLSFDQKGNIVHARDAVKGTKYTCIDCNHEMILKKSEKGVRRPHFSHKALVSNCTPESALHKAYKEMLYGKIADALENKKEFNIIWNCNYCFETHNANLIKKTKYVKKEYSLGICRPDISLLDSMGKPIIAIEIVVTHEPEEKVVKYYNENKITLVKFNLTDENDLDDLYLSFLTPDVVDVCINPKCRACGGVTTIKKLYIIHGRCWRCRKKIKVACIDTNFGSYGVEDFSDNEIKVAMDLGVNIKERYSKTIGSSYKANVCEYCNSFAGQNFLNSEYLRPALRGELKYYSYNIGYTCMNFD